MNKTPQSTQEMTRIVSMATETVEPVAPEAKLYFRFNQMGYLSEGRKLALLLSTAELTSQQFELVGQDGGGVFSATVGADRGEYGKFAHLYEVDFSSFTHAGVYTLRLGAETSAPFVIGEAPYASLIPLSLRFFAVQRCGDTQPSGHAPCHLKDGVAAGGPMDGQPKDASGGWHDAGDYMKFMITSGYTVDLVLAAYLRNPEAFAGEGAVPPVLEEMKVGLDWMVKMWDGENQILYYQAADESDHNDWRLPEKDDTSKPIRPVWACEEGKGANIAGKMSAAMAMAAVIWNDKTQPYYDPALAEQYLQIAQAVYVYGQARPQAQPSNPVDFYTEESWQDDLALAAAELYRATGESAYQADAQRYLAEAGPGRGIYWGDSHALAAYELARLDPTYIPQASDLLKANLEGALADYQAHPFGAALTTYYWGSNEGMAGTALIALWYEDLTGNPAYHDLALAQWDFILGNNPWGVCFVNGAGTLWPKNPHHQVADINQLQLAGFWDEGAVPLTDFEEQEIGNMTDDPLAEFQTKAAVYHDWTPDYVTNEPTISMNATGIALTAWIVLK